MVIAGNRWCEDVGNVRIVDKHSAGSYEYSRFGHVLPIVNPSFAFSGNNSFSLSDVSLHGKVHGDARQLRIHRALPILLRHKGGFPADIVNVGRNLITRNGECRKSGAKSILKHIEADAV